MNLQTLKNYFDYTDFSVWIKLVAWVIIIAALWNFSVLLGGVVLGIFLFFVSDHIVLINRRLEAQRKKEESN